MKRKTFIALLSLTLLLGLYLLFVEKKYEPFDLKPIFPKKDNYIEKIKYEFSSEKQQKPVNYELIRKEENPFSKEHYIAEVTEPVPNNLAEVRVIRFLLSPMVRVYFSELENLSAFEESDDDSSLHSSLGFSPCKEKITFYRKKSNVAQEICLGEKTYNEARRYVLIPNKKIYLTYAHIWQRFQNPIYSLADLQLIPQHYLFNFAELNFLEKKYPLLQEKTKGQIVLVPKKTTMGKEKKETIVWEFFPTGVLPEPFSERLMSTLMSLRYRVLVRLVDKLNELKPDLKLELWQKEVSGKERELVQYLFINDRVAKGSWETISGEKVQVMPQEMLVFFKEGAGILSKEEKERLFKIFQELEDSLKAK